MGRDVIIGASVFTRENDEAPSAAELLGEVEYTPEQVAEWEEDPSVPSLLSDFVESQLNTGKSIRRSVVETLVGNAAACCYLIASLQLEGEPRSVLWIVDNVPGITSGKQLLYQVASLGQSEGLLEKTVDDEGMPHFGLTETGKNVDTEALIGLLAYRYDQMEFVSANQQPTSLKDSLVKNALGEGKEATEKAKARIWFVVKIILAVLLVFVVAYPLLSTYLNIFT